MVEGEKTRFWIPENLAYKGQKPPFGMLVFDCRAYQDRVTHCFRILIIVVTVFQLRVVSGTPKNLSICPR